MKSLTFALVALFVAIGSPVSTVTTQDIAGNNPIYQGAGGR